MLRDQPAAARSPGTLAGALRRRSANGLALAAVVAVTMAVVAWGNVNALLEPDTRRWVLLAANPAIVAVLVGGAHYFGLTWDELGFARRWLLPAAITGLLIGLALSLVPFAFVMLSPFVTGDAVQSGGLRGDPASEVLERIFVHVLISTAISEEALFRGVLFGLWMRLRGPGTAFAVTSVAFLLWHLVISFRGIGNAEIIEGPVLVAGAYIATLAGVFVGGLFFTWLRWQTGSIAAPVAVHWTVNSVMTAALWARA